MFAQIASFFFPRRLILSFKFSCSLQINTQPTPPVCPQYYKLILFSKMVSINIHNTFKAHQKEQDWHMVESIPWQDEIVDLPCRSKHYHRKFKSRPEILTFLLLFSHYDSAINKAYFLVGFVASPNMERLRSCVLLSTHSQLSHARQASSKWTKMLLSPSSLTLKTKYKLQSTGRSDLINYTAHTLALLMDASPQKMITTSQNSFELALTSQSIYCGICPAQDSNVEDGTPNPRRDPPAL